MAQLDAALPPAPVVMSPPAPAPPPVALEVVTAVEVVAVEVAVVAEVVPESLSLLQPSANPKTHAPVNVTLPKKFIFIG